MKKFLISIYCVLCSIVLTIPCVKIDFTVAESIIPTGTMHISNNANEASSIDEERDIIINGKSAVLIDYDSGETLFEQNADEKVQVASIVKLMTILLTFEAIEKGDLRLSDKFIASENAAGMGGSQVFIDPYSEYTIEEMLKSTIVASANDSSVALAEKISGSEELFVKKMNERAKDLGMESTIYVNASGLPEPGQYSTARDVAKLTKEVLKHKQYFEYSTIWMDKLIHPSGRETEVVNTNKLIRYFKGCDGGKTGSTDEAGYCLSATAERGNMRLIGVVLGAKTGTERFNETSKLLNYGFTHFENKQIIDKNEAIVEIPITKSKITSVGVYAEESFYGINKKDENTEYNISINVPEKIKAPLLQGERIGSIIVSKNGVILKEIALVVGQDIADISYKEAIKEIISRW